ncbi:cytochrome o ubiquinol oxidase subunit II [Buchnera aphidicola (Aphis glycines)]|uniref:Ubiquinol oxidase subunit 2 n=1 Tax=Buchnera aphidicola (Aphis glycines) TaxID=1265350 RepID=A0A0M4HB86_9GAMM|nr:ubiquinol oxidase subunit II [Buchnera aphidicola]ALD15399.1 cytochrome o ubiquinol oxidase subunit II [Buchnera aphidicola (Aphis glycines)]
MIYKNLNKFKILLLISNVFILNGCNNMLLTSHGTIAKQEHSLILISFIMMLFVIVPVFFMTIYFSVKYRASNINQIYKPDCSESKIIETIVWFIPVLIISFLAYLTWNYCHVLDPQKSIVSKYKPIKINVIALDWRWLFIYPDYNIASINEIAFPVNTPVIFNITSNSVMNSFFIPSLGSQIYAMPGMITKLNLISNDSGKYKGISSNYSGKGFSNMKFTAISLPNKKVFLSWINKIQKSPKQLNTIKMFQKVSFPNENHYVEYFSNVDQMLFKRIFY